MRGAPQPACRQVRLGLHGCFRLLMVVEQANCSWKASLASREKPSVRLYLAAAVLPDGISDLHHLNSTCSAHRHQQAGLPDLLCLRLACCGKAGAGGDPPSCTPPTFWRSVSGPCRNLQLRPITCTGREVQRVSVRIAAAAPEGECVCELPRRGGSTRAYSTSAGE